MLGIFGNVTDESLVPQLDAVGTPVYQKQFAANLVYKVGGNNDMSPVQQWDWGVYLDSANGQTVDIQTATFQLTAPGLTSAQVLDAANQGWYFGVRIRHTLGPKGKTSIGFPVTPPPSGNAPTIAITTPAEGALSAQSDVSVSGVITGTSPLAVTVNGIWAYLSSGFASFQRTLTDGTHTIRALIGNAWGYAGDDVSITVDTTAPVIGITAPASGTLTTASSIAVAGTATDATSGVASVVVNGVTATVTGGTWSASVALVEGSNTLTASATNSFGSGSGSGAVELTLDTTPPVVTIAAPASGTIVATQPIAVSGTVADASAITSLRINGDPITANSSFATTAALAVGPNPITVEATDAAGNVGTATISVSYEPASALAITIEPPPDGALFSAADVDVAGSVSDPTATVRVNGVLATVTGAQWVAARVPLVEGSNPLAATATRASATASDSVTVTYNAPPSVVITSPRAGDLFRTGSADVEGVVDDAAAFVDVNGVVASVGAGGRFAASGVALAPGDNTLIARAIDALGAKGSDSVAVVRDDAAAGRSRLVVIDTNSGFVGAAGNSAFADLAEWEENLRIGNAVGDSPPTPSRPVPASRDRMQPPPEVPTAYPQNDLFLLSENEDAASFEVFVGDETAPFVGPLLREALPIEDLASYLYLPSIAYPAAFAPAEFTPRFFALAANPVLPCIVDSCPGNGVANTRLRYRATANAIRREIALFADTARPTITIESPAGESVIAGGLVTVTGTVADAGPLLDTIRYEVFDDLGVPTASGTAPLLVDAAGGESRGRFATPALDLGSGFHSVHVTAWDSIGNRRRAETGFEIDADAPAASLVSPLDGSAFTESEVQASFNFGAPTTLVSVNGVADGRSFPAGIASNILTLPLALGPNVYQLEVQNSAGLFSVSFTLHRVSEQGEVRIITPVGGDLVNTHTITVAGTVPLGTPVVLVNGVLGAIAPDRVSFTATIPVPSTANFVINGEAAKKPFAITAEALPFGASASIEITPDFVAPSFRVALPADGTVTSAASIALSGFVSEAATVSIETPAGPIAVRTARDRAREDAEPFNLFRVIQYHRYELPPIALAAGANALTLRAVDRAGNATTRLVTLSRADAALALVSPAAGSAVAGLVTSVTLHATEAVTIDAWVVAGRQVPSLAGATVAAGVDTAVGGIPLAPGANGVRIVYHRLGGTSEVLSFSLTSTATSYATVSGQVTDARTGAAVAGALVSITAGGVDITVVTDADGNYVAPVVPGSIGVATVAEGYATASMTGSAAAGGTLAADVGLASTGIPAVMNEVRILVPPAGAVTDFEMLTVVGTVLNRQSTVTVNGIAAQVVGNRFTAKHVPLAMGANTIAASATVLGLPVETRSVGVERSDTPVLQVKLFSPPDGATIPGSGFVARGWVSAKNARVLVADQGAVVLEGVFEALDLPASPQQSALSALAQLREEPLATDSAEIHVTRADRAVRLSADPVSGEAPLEVGLEATVAVPLSIARVDFDLDGDGELDLQGHPSGAAETTYPAPRPHRPRVFLTTSDGVELTALARVGVFLPPVTLRTFAAGSPVDLADGSDGSIYVLDSAAGVVRRFDENGTLVQTIGASGSGTTQLSNPQGIAVADDSAIYVADTGNDRIQVYAPGGAWQRSIGASGTGLGQFRGPRAVAIDGDALVVADTGNGRLQRLPLVSGAPSSVPLAGATGLGVIRGNVVIGASPMLGVLRAYFERTLQNVEAIDTLPTAAIPRAPVDLAEGTGTVVIADTAPGRMILLDSALRLRRVVEGMGAIRAVLPSQRPEMESIFVADGQQVREIGLPTESPLPAVEALRTSLAAGDIEAALRWIAPAERARFARVYELMLPVLAGEAAAMADSSVLRLREEQAIVVLRRAEIFEGQPVVNGYPMHLIRAGDGEWRVLDY